MLPTASNGNYFQPVAISRVSAPRINANMMNGRKQKSDPRFVRSLPWVPRQVGNIPRPLWLLAIILYFAIPTFCVLGLPGWIIWRSIRKRQFSVKSLLAFTAAIAVSITCYQLLTTMANAMPSDTPTFLRLVATLAGLPIIAFPMLAASWIRNRALWRAVAFVLLTVGVSLVNIIVLIAQDSQRMQPDEYYEWDGWYFIVFSSCYFSVVLFIFGQQILLSSGKFLRWICRTDDKVVTIQ